VKEKRRKKMNRKVETGGNLLAQCGAVDVTPKSDVQCDKDEKEIISEMYWVFRKRSADFPEFFESSTVKLLNTLETSGFQCCIVKI
jgi:hypothetical protein